MLCCPGINSAGRWRERKSDASLPKETPELAEQAWGPKRLRCETLPVPRRDPDGAGSSGMSAGSWEETVTDTSQGA